MAEKMNPEVKRQWLEALRSGRYKQTRGALVTQPYDTNPDNPGYCCLGVLCEVAADAGIVRRGEWVDPVDDDVSSRGYEAVNPETGEWDRETAVLPMKVLEWAGIEARSPLANDRVLATMNDEGVPFTELADLIEEHL